VTPPGAVILAAGRGRRLGRGPKAFVRLDGTSLVARAVALCRAAGIPVERTVMVLPPGADGSPELARAVTELGSPAPGITINPDPDGSGPLGSLVAGLRSMPDGPGAILAHPVDHPWVSREDVIALLAAGTRPGAAATVPTWEGRGGHPILLHPPGIAAVRAVSNPGATTLRDVLDAAGGRHRVAAATDGVLRNLNTAADLA